MIFESPRGAQETPKILFPTSFRTILVHLEPLQGPDACLEVIFIDFLDSSKLLHVFSWDFRLNIGLNSMIFVIYFAGLFVFLSL